MVSSATRQYIGLNERFLVGQLLASHDIRMNPNAALVYVGSTHVNAGTGKDGLDPNNPLSTIDEAIGACTANRGDVVVVLPGHVDATIAAGTISLDVAGVTVLCMGQGALRPTITAATSTAATVLISAASCNWIGGIFVCNIDAQTTQISVTAADVSLINIETRDTAGTAQAVSAVTASAAATRFLLREYKHRGDPAAGATDAVHLSTAADMTVEDFDIEGNFSTAGINQIGTAARFRVRSRTGRPCFIWNQNSADVGVSAAAGTTGFVAGPLNIMCTDNAANITEAVTAAAMQQFDNIYVCNLAGEKAMLINTTASTDA